MKLLLVWLAGLAWGVGLFLTLMGFLGAALGGMLSGFASSSAPNFVQCMVLLIGASLVVTAPIALGRFLDPNRSGIVNGVIAVFLWPIVLAVQWGIFGGFYSAVSDLPRALAFPLFDIATLATVTILLILREWNLSAPRRALGIGIGVLVGFALIVLLGLGLRPGILKADNSLHLIWIVPSLVWTSVFSFTEFTAGKQRLSALLLWVLLSIATFVLPILVVPFYCINC